MAGLINETINKQDPLASVAGYEPDKVTLDPTTDTVAGQVNKIVSSDSPLMTGARTRAAEAANSRGLLNSSMAVQAGEEAVHNAALPIATADAGINLDVKKTNAAAGNQAGQVNSTNQTQAAIQALSGNQKTEQIAQQGALDTQLQTLKGDQAQRLAELDASSKALLQSSASATSLYNTITSNMSKIMQDPNLTPENKQIAIDQHINFIQSGLAVIGAIGGLDLTSLLSFG